MKGKQFKSLTLRAPVFPARPCRTTYPVRRRARFPWRISLRTYITPPTYSTYTPEKAGSKRRPVAHLCGRAHARTDLKHGHPSLLPSSCNKASKFMNLRGNGLFCTQLPPSVPPSPWSRFRSDDRPSDVHESESFAQRARLIGARGGGGAEESVARFN